MFKSTKKFSYIILIFIVLTNISSANEYQNDANTYSKNYNKTNNETTSESIAEEPGTYLFVWFVIFFCMGLYMICSMKNYQETKNRTYDVWKFIYFTNNGILLFAGLNIFNLKNVYLDSVPFSLCFLCFIIISIYIICKCPKCNLECTYRYFTWEYLGESAKIPCFIWQLVGLTDPCCRSESYTVTYYSDGSTESTECCHHTWNLIIFLIKRFAVLISFFSFYIFFMFYFLLWLIGKLILFIYLKCSKIQVIIIDPQQQIQQEIEYPKYIFRKESIENNVEQNNNGNKIAINYPVNNDLGRGINEKPKSDLESSESSGRASQNKLESSISTNNNKDIERNLDIQRNKEIERNFGVERNLDIERNKEI